MNNAPKLADIIIAPEPPGAGGLHRADTNNPDDLRAFHPTTDHP